MNDPVPLLKFTPSAQSPEILEAITVQREPLIARLVESAVDRQGGTRHHLLVGPRGIGKTHIASIVASRIRGHEHADSVVLAWLDEDPWAVRTYGKFMAAVIARVADETGDPGLVQGAARARSSGKDADGSEAEHLLRAAVGDRRLVLLVENLDEIFRRIGADGQSKLRAFAEDWGDLLIIATTPQLFAGVRRHTSPFYGFFAVTHLEELSLENAAALLRRVAQLRGDSELVEFLGTETAMSRLTAVQALAGGHPRVWLLLAGCISIAAIDELVPLFVEALDDLTPYYQDRLRALGDQQQEVVVLLSEAGGALSNRQLAERSGVGEKQIATILRHLGDRGYVRRAELPDDLASGDRRMSYWELREPLMRLCLDVKQARGEPLRIVVEFLRAWYGPRLLDELIKLPPSAKLAVTYASEAYRGLDAPAEVEALLRGSPGDIVARAERGLSLLPDDFGLRLAKAAGLAAEQRYAEAKDAFRQLLARDDLPLEASAPMRLQLAWIQQALGDTVEFDGILADAWKLERSAPSAESAMLLALGYELCDRPRDALGAWDDAVARDPSDPRLLGRRAVALGSLGRHEEAVAAGGQALELDPTDARLHADLGASLLQLDRDEEALAAYWRAAEIVPSNAHYHAACGVALLRLDRYEESLAAFTRAVEIDASNGDYQRRRALLLCLVGRDEEALDVYTHAVELDPEDAATHNSRADVLRRLGRTDEAERAVHRAIALDPEDPVSRFTLAEVVLTRGDTEAAVGRFAEALAAWSESPHAGPPGDTIRLCRIAWERFHGDARRRGLIAELVSLYGEADSLEELGRGVVASIALFAGEEVPQQAADAWVDDWAQAKAPELEIPLRLTEAARMWKRDRDRAHLLALPVEQREVVRQLLEAREGSASTPSSPDPARQSG